MQAWVQHWLLFCCRRPARASPRQRSCCAAPSQPQGEEFVSVLEPLFRQIARCLTSSHFQVGGCPNSVQGLEPLPGRLPALGCPHPVSRCTAVRCGCIVQQQCAVHHHLSSLLEPNPPGPSSQVAERSLFLWNNEYIVQLVAAHRAAVLPLVLGALEQNAATHWNPAVHR